ncbi:MAG: hypothetical protein COA56_15860 [Dehalococcoidia bacterium]|nr:MAG: hypothetical protein COA56_15860 [Dehalococcoidia bacterium]
MTRADRPDSHSDGPPRTTWGPGKSAALSLAAFAVIFGIGYGGEGSAFPVINRQYFGRGPMGSSFGWQQLGAGSGMALGAWVGGALFWIFDSYTATILVSTFTSIAGAVVIMSMEPTGRVLIPSWEDTVPAVPATADD